MSIDTFTYDPNRRVLVVPSPRLTRVLQHEPQTCATVDEYAVRTGLSSGEVMKAFEGAVAQGALDYEMFGGTIFVLTGPRGRPGPAGVPEVPPNLWETLRIHSSLPDAYRLWQTYRALTYTAGWQVVVNTKIIGMNLGPVPFVPKMGVRLYGGMVVPLVLFPPLEEIAAHDSELAAYARAAAPVVGVLCESGALSPAVTEIRRWGASHPEHASLAVMVMEAPMYSPTVITLGDASVRPMSVDAVTGMQGPVPTR